MIARIRGAGFDADVDAPTNRKEWAEANPDTLLLVALDASSETPIATALDTLAEEVLALGYLTEDGGVDRRRIAGAIHWRILALAALTRRLYGDAALEHDEPANDAGEGPTDETA